MYWKRKCLRKRERAGLKGKNLRINFVVVVILEIMFLLCNFIRNIEDDSYEILDSDSFSVLQDAGIVAEPDGVKIPAGCSGDVLESREIDVSPGIYDILISYEGGGDDVSIWFYSSTIRSGTVVLKEDKKEMSFRAWVSTARENEVFHLNTQGSAFKLKSIILVRNGKVFACYVLTIQTFFIMLLDILWLLWSRRVVLPGGSKTLIQVFGIVGIAVMASMPLFVRNMVPGIDIVFHLFRIEGVAESIRMGQLPVRMQPFWFDGRGYPVSVFYCDIFLYFPAILRLLGFTLQDAYKCYVFAINLATAYITWYCIRKIFENDAVALTGSAIYTLSVYRLINVYVRAALGEVTAMVFFPLAIYGFWKIVRLPKEKKQQPFSWVPMTVGYSGIILSHMLSSEMAVILTASACVIFIKKVFHRDIFCTLLKAVAATITVTAWFLVPFLDYMQDSYNITAEPGYGLEENAAFLGQMFGLHYSGLTNRYSLDLNSGVHNEMSMGVGFVLLLGAALFIMLTIMLENHQHPLWKLGNFCLWMSFCCIWMSSSLFPWGNIIQQNEVIAGLAGMLQFSWRFLGMATVFLVVTACSGMTLLANMERHKYYAVIVVFLILNTVTWGNFLETSLIDNENAVYYSAANLYSLPWGNGDYLPYGSDYWSYIGERNVCAEDVEIIDSKVHPLQVEVSCRSEQGGSISVPLIYYRHYYAQDIVSGEALSVDCDFETYTVRVMIPSEFDGDVLVKFREPWFWRVSEIISLGAVIGIFLSIFFHSKYFRYKFSILST